jgi:hypothetical protein
MAITALPNCAVRNRDENRAQNTWRMPESGVSLSQFYWRTRTTHQNAGVSRRKLATGRRQLVIWMQVVPVIAVQTVVIVSVPEGSEAVHGVMAADTEASAANAVHATAGHSADINTAAKPSSHASTASDASHVKTAAKSSHVSATTKTSHVATAAKAAAVTATAATACLGRGGKQA